MGVGADTNDAPPELWDGRYYLGGGSAPGPNAATNFGHSACYKVQGGGPGDEGITAAEWYSITAAAKVSTFAMATAINATPAAPWWARKVAAASAAGMLTTMRDRTRAKYAGWDGVSLASPWIG